MVVEPLSIESAAIEWNDRSVQKLNARNQSLLFIGTIPEPAAVGDEFASARGGCDWRPFLHLPMKSFSSSCYLSHGCI